MSTAAASIRSLFAPRRWAAALARVFQPQRKHPFDRAHGVDTDGLIYADSTAQGHAGARHNAGYYATAPSLFHGAIDLWRATLPATGYVLEDYALVDIGCGKGRVLMLASGYPFREILGVELNPELARVARKNLCKWSRRRPRSPLAGKSRVQIVEADALVAPLPDGPAALFYFNSFEQEMTEMWLARLGEIVRRRAAPLDLIYIHPEFDALVRQVPGVRSLAEADIPLTHEDAGADAFGVNNDRCALYRWATSVPPYSQDDGQRGHKDQHP